MDAVLLARLQFALTIGFHFIFPPLTIGMAWVIVLMLGRARRSNDPFDQQLARFWIKIFTLSFAVGVATGITMEFQFGTNWANYSRFVGDIFGAPLAIEAVFTFFLESTFLGVLLFGEKRVSRNFYWLAAWLVALGSTLSAFWIIVANSWQQTPAGYEIVDGRAQLTSFVDVVFNPSTVPRFLHTFDAALISGSLAIAGMAAWMLLKRRHVELATRSLRLALLVTLVASLLQIGLGHAHALQVIHTQPVKFAAFEGMWETQDHAPLTLLGWPDAEAETTHFDVHIHPWVSIMAGLSPTTRVQGLKDFPRAERPPLLILFWSWRFMVGTVFVFLGISLLGLWLLRRNALVANRRFLWLLLLASPLPLLANEVGWIAAEVGRQPWAVWKLLRTDQAHSPVVPAGQIVLSIVLLCAVYALLFGVWIFVLRRKLLKGPDDVTSAAASAPPAEVTP